MKEFFNDLFSDFALETMEKKIALKIRRRTREFTGRETYRSVCNGLSHLSPGCIYTAHRVRDIRADCQNDF